MDLRKKKADPRLKYLNVTARYSMVHGTFGYPDNAVVCVLVDGQYLLMPHSSLGSLAKASASFSALPDDLKLRVPGNKRIEVGHLRQSIRKAALDRPEVLALATWTEFRPDDHYQLITSEDEITRMWIERYLEESKIELGQTYGVSLSEVIPCIDHTMHSFTVFSEHLKFTGVVKLYGDSSLYSVYSTWDCRNWVWSPSKGSLLRGNPGLHALPGFRE